MKKLLIVIVVSIFVALFLSRKSHAHMKVGEFVDRCDVYTQSDDRDESANPKQLMSAAYCLGLMEGVTHTVFWTLNIKDIKSSDWKICFPPNLNNKLVIRMLVEHLKIYQADYDDFLVPWLMYMLKVNFQCNLTGEKHVSY